MLSNRPDFPVGPIRGGITLILPPDNNRMAISVLLTCMIIIVEHTIISFVKVRLLDLIPQPKIRGSLICHFQIISNMFP